ncbi:uncharacterized protein si:ch211-183d21.1 isoform X2 [Polyodon spathula]|uniref:uncharacterized protein si:ch211-183d21.1 isoform X2 n=1 Tax=Polyodon spathula TaxID=7913 RepID=UPI001B7DD45B|nr:uncharacterized protein si:ch211-183d21.1 isoform X2 [Polyodon spathula]
MTMRPSLLLCSCLWALACAGLVLSLDEGCLLISEVNADNPGLDTTEFVELHHSSGQRASLEGYTLVFYNGNGNMAYKVLNLTGHVTEDSGYFLVGSASVSPRPAIILPANSIQNGLDGIALYHGENGYSVGMKVTATGLVDAIVYKSRPSDSSRVLEEVLTPGKPCFLEDGSFQLGDESIERCWLSRSNWTFQAGTPSPGRTNPCTSPSINSPVQISELRLGEGVFLELSMPQPAPTSTPLALVLLDGVTATVSFSLDIQIQDSTSLGLFLIAPVRGNVSASQVLPPEGASLLQQSGALAGAVVLYAGGVADYPTGSPISQDQPIDALVYTGGGVLNPNLTQTLIPGREPFLLSSRLQEGGVSLSRCGAAKWSRDPGVFIGGHPTPGQANECLGLGLCPYTLVQGSTIIPPVDPSGHGEFLLSEVNADSPGAREDYEFIEIWHTSGQQASLDGVWLLLFNGFDNKAYQQMDLTGHRTDPQGFFLVGSSGVTPRPSIVLPPNTVQNGPDAVALYRSPQGPPFTQGGSIPTEGLLDAVVYRSRGSDKGARVLGEVLTPGQPHLLEDPSFSSVDESLSRCGSLKPRLLAAFQVTLLTPMKENACAVEPTLHPQPTLKPKLDGFVIFEVVGANWTNATDQQAFVELRAPPQSSMVGYVLVVFEQGPVRASISIPLTGESNSLGFYLIGTSVSTNQRLPVISNGTPIPQRGAVALYHGFPSSFPVGMPASNRSLVDAVVFSDDQELLQTLTPSSQLYTPEFRPELGLVSLSRCSCCELRTPQAWTPSKPTPQNDSLCPSQTFPLELDLCVSKQRSRGGSAETDCRQWLHREGSREAMRSEVALYLESHCHCGFSPVHLHEAQFSCYEGQIRLRGHILALSEDQRNNINQTLKNTSLMQLSEGMVGMSCQEPGSYRSQGSEMAPGWEIALVFAALLVVGLAVAAAYYWYRRRAFCWLLLRWTKQAAGDFSLQRFLLRELLLMNFVDFYLLYNCILISVHNLSAFCINAHSA